MNHLYIFSVPFVNAFNFSSVFIYPLIISCLAFLTFQFNVRKKLELSPIPNDYLLICFSWLLLSTVSALFSVNHVNLMHLISYASFTLIFIIFPIIFLRSIGFNKVIYYCYLITLTIGFIALLEFILLNFYDTKPNFYRPRVQELEVLFFGFYRVRSIFEEPGHFASFYCTFFPLALVYLKVYKKHPLLLLISMMGFITSFSIAGLFFMSIFLLGYLILSKNYIFTILIFLLVVIFILFFIEPITNILLMIYELKLSSGSLEGRLSRFTQDEFDFSENIRFLFTGLGPGSYEGLDYESSLSAYMNIFHDLGLIGILIFLYPYFTTSIKLLNSNYSKYRFLLLSSLFSALYFLLAIPNYFYPHFYIPLIVCYLFKERNFKEDDNFL